MNQAAHDPNLVGKRLEIIRLAKDIGTQPQFAKILNVSKNRYNNWATGGVLIPVEYAVRIKELTGATLEYIYLGDRSSLPLSLAQSIQRAEASSSPSDIGSAG